MVGCAAFPEESQTRECKKQILHLPLYGQEAVHGDRGSFRMATRSDDSAIFCDGAALGCLIARWGRLALLGCRCRLMLRRG